MVLASASPRRAELLRQIGLNFSVVSTDIDETPLDGEKAPDYVQRLAVAKAVAANCLDSVVIGSDTTVLSPSGEIFGKPANEAEALRMLQQLSGNTHEVLSSVAVLWQGSSHVLLSRSLVTFKSISKSEAQAYWQSGEPLGKAGGYAIQGLGAVFVRELQGSYSGVMGLPLAETAELLNAVGIHALPRG